jgi:hypothetical protein
MPETGCPTENPEFTAPASSFPAPQKPYRDLKFLWQVSDVSDIIPGRKSVSYI